MDTSETEIDVELGMPADDDDAGLVGENVAVDTSLEVAHEDNLVNYFSTEEELKELEAVGSDVVDLYEADRMSRSSWESTVTKYLDNLGLDISNSDPDDQIFEGACNADHPLVIEAAIKYQSKASSELLPAKGPVKTQLINEADPNPELETKATGIKNFLNHQIVNKMPEFQSDSERALFAQGVIGSVFKRVYYNSVTEVPTSDCVFPDQLVVNSTAKDLERAERISYEFIVSEDRFQELVDEGLFVDHGEDPYDIELAPFQEKINSLLGISQTQYDVGYQIVEQHISLVLPSPFGDPEERYRPYIVYVDKKSSKVLGVYKNWDEEDTKFKRRDHFVHYPFIVGFGFYGYGYAHLLGNMQVTLTAVMRSLVDSGQFANMQGGFKLKNFKVVDNSPIAPGEFKDIEYAGTAIKDAIMPLNFKEPSSTLFALMEFLESRGQKFADSTEQVVSDSVNYGPVGTTMALLEASTKFFSAIHKRNHAALKQELNLICKINKDYVLVNNPEMGEPFGVTAEDFHLTGLLIVPVSDPNISSNAHRLTVAQSRLEAGMRAPEMHNMRELYADFYRALGDTNIDRYLPDPEKNKPQPLDPISDIMSATQGKPIAAFPEQDHAAHMKVKAAWLEDPVGGASAFNQNAIPVIQANIREHMIMQWQATVQGMAENLGGEMSERLLAEAAEKTKGYHTSEMSETDPLMLSALADLEKTALDREKFEHSKGIDLVKLGLEQRDLDIKALEALAGNNAEEAKLAQKIMSEDKQLGMNLIIQALTKAKSSGDN